jgi:integrase
MPKKRTKELITGKHFQWRLGQRDGVYYADGRSNRPNAGRHSLGTRDRAKALEELKRLDVVKAVAFGLADRRSLDQPAADVLSLEEGRRRYEAHVARPPVTGGVKRSSAKRYRAVLDKFLKFARGLGITAWTQVTMDVLKRYATWLHDKGYAYATQYLELTTILQVLKWMRREKLLPRTKVPRLSLSKPGETTTYCWKREEVAAIVEFCRAHPELAWLADVVAALACTGMRISELAGLRWSDVDLANRMIRLTDESTRGRRRGRPEPRTLKSGRSRSFPIHDDLLPMFARLQRHTDGVVFHGPLGGRLKPDTVRNALVRDVIAAIAPRFPTPAAGTGFEHGRLHSFRHYFCSQCANDGVAEAAVMEWLGHRDSAMVRHYYHLHDAEAKRQMQRVQFLDVNGGTGAAAS